MTAVAFLLIGCSLLCVALFWSLPRHIAQNGVAALTFASLAAVAPAAALWLSVTTLATPLAMRAGDRTGHRGAAAGLWIFALAAALFASREVIDVADYKVIWVGGAYFTLRHIHVVMEWWLGRLPIPDYGAYIRYQFFLPTLMAGPINRIQLFERQCARRRWDAADFFSGAERALFGVALSVMIGGYAFARLDKSLVDHLAAKHGFAENCLISVVEWMQLYVTFSALTHIALGLSLMLGLRLEENFNRPWQARNIVEFWQRWHMTLSFWCRDYVFTPLTALTRSPMIGVLAAMLVLGLWHETSAYYVLWAVWQALGIVLTRLYVRAGDPLGLARWPEWIKAIVGPLHVLIWISLARPIFETIAQLVK